MTQIAPTSFQKDKRHIQRIQRPPGVIPWAPLFNWGETLLVADDIREIH